MRPLIYAGYFSSIVAAIYVPVVVYKQDNQSIFNDTYYLQVHLPWIESLWAPFGMKGYTVTRLEPSAPYSYITMSFFDSQDQFDAAFNDSGKEIYARVSHYSNREPIRWAGELLV